MATISVASKAPVLNSWKEIAQYVDRGVRTVQRYEKQFHLPVRRLCGNGRRGSVIAVPEELDAWLRRAQTSDLKATSLRTSTIVNATHGSVEEHADLRRRCSELREENQRAIARLTASLQAMNDQLSISRQLRPKRAA